MIGLRSRVKLNDRRLARKVDQASFRSLGHAAGAIRLTASRSIRRRKSGKPSSPGTPPHTRTGNLKRAIRYEIDKMAGVVVGADIGPVNLKGGRLWDLHEHGGVSRRRRLLKEHAFSPGEYGPIRIKQGGYNTSFHRTKLRTRAQANRATRLISEENIRRRDIAAAGRRYPKRPFMGPALEKNRSRLPRFWANSVR